MKINLIESEKDRISLVRALCNLKHDHYFNVLLEFLNLEQATIDRRLRRETEKIGILQGRSQILEELFELVETSTDVMKELSKSDE